MEQLARVFAGFAVGIAPVTERWGTEMAAAEVDLDTVLRTFFVFLVFFAHIHRDKVVLLHILLAFVLFLVFFKNLYAKKFLYLSRKLQ